MGCVCAQDRRTDRHERAYIRVWYLQANEDEIERVAQQLRQSTKVLTRNLQVVNMPQVASFPLVSERDLFLSIPKHIIV
jgi:hypothetical protein